MNLEFSRKKVFILLVVLFVVFLMIRLPAIYSPYHQDEYKWVQYSHPEITPPGTVPHPPLTELIYAKTLGPLFGDDNFRLIPLLFSIANLFLIFYLAKNIFDPFDKSRANKTAFWVASLFTVSFYSILASLMVDVDGAVMPFFFLIMMIGYYKLRILNKNNWGWLVLVIIGAIGGFMVKMSGALPIAALFIDFLIEKGIFSDKKRVLKYLGLGFLVAACLVGILFLAKYVFPFFNLEYSLKYWKHFADSSSFLDRGWLQTLIQFTKSIFYTSPLLLLPLFFIDKEIWKKARPLFLFLFIGLVFYLLVFDFSIGALDRYFEFLIVPLCLISGAIFAKLMDKGVKIAKKEIVIVSFISVAIFLFQFLNHVTPPLYPKTDWLNRIISLKWDFLFPFMGGSGPVPFYVSFGFIALMWIFGLVLVIPAFLRKNIKKQILIGVLILGSLYNLAFIEEYLFGKINGSSPQLVYGAVEFIKNNDDIKSLRVYNDNGGFDVMKVGKYGKRLYLDPKFYMNQSGALLKADKGFYLVVNIPHIDSDTAYGRYFLSCNIIYNQKSGEIEAFVYDCRNAQDVKL